MPGPYAHLTLVSLLDSPNGLAGLGRLPKNMLSSLLLYIKFFELGAVSPDYPYLSVLNGAAKDWADTMHHQRTGDRLKAGIQYVTAMPSPEKYKALAWLLGFASHVIADATIHPIVELKVGPYVGNEKAHRTCEMHQDVFIYKTMNVGNLHSPTFLQDGIATCDEPGHADRLDPSICAVWGYMLKTVDSQLYRDKPPDFHAWHRMFKTLLSASTPGHFFPWSRHMALGDGYLYPTKPDGTYINALQTPNGGSLPYLEIFERAKANTRKYWAIIVRACLAGNEAGLPRIKNWDMDTGKDETGTLTFWK
ncbi:MAG: zinc dependent phospholipase C family protein [Proteobacteria bacterium]|nr:zinc dependent phospholipase C family protein [Pseudomonadota bacterium]